MRSKSICGRWSTFFKGMEVFKAIESYAKNPFISAIGMNLKVIERTLSG
ncbi:hypothetical protein [Candidatus Lariskella endosymbiont of Epinotia ramella]